MYSTSNMNSTMDKNNMILPFQIRFENALKEQNILSKCKFIADLIEESLSHNIKDMQHRYLLLVEDIFSFQMTSFGSNNWRLKYLTREMNPKEFDSIYYLLSIDGPLFKLIRHLMNDSNNRYEFPISYLPCSTRIQSFVNAVGLHHNFTANFYANKLTQSASSLSLNAFEFYMFHFACYITKETTQQYSFLESGNVDTNFLYYVLLERYLEYFIPLYNVQSIFKPTEMNNLMNTPTDGKSSLWKSLSSTTTNLLNLSSSKPVSFGHGGGLIFDKAENNPNRDPASFTESTLRPKMLAFSKFPQNLNAFADPLTNDMLGSVTYKCETVLGIFVEVLLNYNRDEKQKMMPTNFNITLEHMKVIRIFIKHLHYFANSLKNKYGEFSGIEAQTQYNSGGFVTSNLHDPLDEIKRNLWTFKYSIQKNLYQFLRIIFDRWPNDSSFRAPLETWLSFIQPWRYTNTKNETNETIQSNDQYNWRRFVSDNILFYTILFRQVITRMCKQLDLNTNHNSLLVYRVLKVFAQDNLKNWIKDSEMNFLCSSDMSMSYGGRSNTLFSTPNAKHQMHQHSPSKSILIEYENYPTGEYVSIFSPAFRDQIIELLLKIAKSLQFVNESLSEQSKTDLVENNKSFLDSIMNFFLITNQNCTVSQKQFVDVDKTRNHLNSSIEFISSIFDIPQQSIETILVNAKKASTPSKHHPNQLNNEEDNIFNIVNGVPKFTEFGRSQIQNGTFKPKHSQKILEANPDTQPVRSFEIAILVKFALFLSFIINEKFGQHFKDNYHKQNNLYGALLRMILSAPVSYSQLDKKSQQIQFEHLPPRINLRFLASIDFIFNSLLLTVLCLLFYWLNSILTFLILFLLTPLIFFLFKMLN